MQEMDVFVIYVFHIDHAFRVSAHEDDLYIGLEKFHFMASFFAVFFSA